MKTNKALDKQLYFKNALNKIADIIIASNKAEEILENANRIISETLEVDRSVIYEVSFEKNTLTGLIEWLRPNYPDIVKTLGVYPLDLVMTPVEIIRKSGNYIESHITRTNENFNQNLTNLLHEKLNIKSLIWYPFAIDDNGFHVFALNQIIEIREWTTEDIGFLESAAKQVSLALIKIQLRESESKYRQLFDNIKKSNQELIKLNAEKDKLFSIIAHDLRSPFFSLLGFTEILAFESQEMSSAEIKNLSLSLNESAGNLYKLLVNLLEWAQVQKGEINFNPRTFSLFQAYIQSMNPIRQRAVQKEITIVNEISGNQEIYADENMLSSILRNLLSNAVKFSNRGGKVIVKAIELANGMIEISVSDNGIGIPENIIDKLFKLGEKVNSPGTDNEPSTGLGLILCKEFVEKHKGNIWAQSEAGKGSTFYFTIPSA